MGHIIYPLNTNEYIKPLFTYGRTYQASNSVACMHAGTATTSVVGQKFDIIMSLFYNEAWRGIF